MDPITLPIVALVAIGALLLGAGLCFVVMHTRYGERMHEAALRIDRAAKARQQANELLLQARRQIELLNKEVELARRFRVAAPPEPAALVAPDEPATVVMQRPAGFADTLPYQS